MRSLIAGDWKMHGLAQQLREIEVIAAAVKYRPGQSAADGHRRPAALWSCRWTRTFGASTRRFRSALRSLPIPAGSYGSTDYQLTGGRNASHPLSLSHTLITGGLWSGQQRTQQLAMEARPTSQLAASLGVSHTAATLDAPQASFEALLWDDARQLLVHDEHVLRRARAI